jgi:hypothetical protein
MRIPTLLQKIGELASRPETRTAIDVDLMMDYTRVLYADLLEWRSKLPANIAEPVEKAPMKEPTLEELTAAMERAKPAEPVQQEPKPIVTKPVPTPEQPNAGVDNKNYDRPVFAKPSQSGQSQPAPQRDIRTMISINDKYQIMSELFGNDKAAYEQAIDYINQSKSEPATMQWLREQLWITEEHSDAAQSFFDIIARFYRG